MGRGRRIELAGAVYHLITRSADGGMLARDDADRDRRVAMVREACRSFDWSILTYTLMGTHEHALVLTRNANLSRGLHWLNGVYAARSNRINGLVGHRIRERSRAILIGGRSHLLNASIYVHLNPVRAGIASDPMAWSWSTCRAMFEPDHRWAESEPERVLRLISPDLDEARELYRERLLAKESLRLPDPWVGAHLGRVQGPVGFVRAVMRKLGLPGPSTPDELVRIAARFVAETARRPDGSPLRASETSGLVALVAGRMPGVDDASIGRHLGYRSTSSVSRSRARAANIPWLAELGAAMTSEILRSCGLVSIDGQ